MEGEGGVSRKRDTQYAPDCVTAWVSHWTRESGRAAGAGAIARHQRHARRRKDKEQRRCHRSCVRVCTRIVSRVSCLAYSLSLRPRLRVRILCAPRHLSFLHLPSDVVFVSPASARVMVSMHLFLTLKGFLTFSWSACLSHFFGLCQRKGSLVAGSDFKFGLPTPWPSAPSPFFALYLSPTRKGI